MLNDTAQLSVIGSVAGQQHIHTLHFRLLDATSTNLEPSLIDSWQAACRTTFRGLFGTADSPCQLYRAQQVCGSLPLRAPAEEAEVSPNIAGSLTLTTDQLAPWLAAVISWRTAFAGRSRRGRNYFGGMSEEMVVGSTIHSTQLARLAAYRDAVLGEFGPSGASLNYRLVVHSRKIADTGVDCTASSTAITSGLVRDQLASMKSRKAGHGN